jgi:phosphoribosyl-dephospho-CoA transferase
LISSLQENRTKRPRGGDGISKKTGFKSKEERKQALAELNERYAKELEQILPSPIGKTKAKTKKVMDKAVEQLSDLKEKIDEQIEEKRAAEPAPVVLPSVETAPRMDDLGKL